MAGDKQLLLAAQRRQDQRPDAEDIFAVGTIGTSSSCCACPTAP